MIHHAASSVAVLYSDACIQLYIYDLPACWIANYLAIRMCSQVKVRKQFPLTSIYEIVYNKEENPKAFKLQFHKSEILLEAHDKRDCELWVKAIAKGACL